MVAGIYQNILIQSIVLKYMYVLMCILKRSDFLNYEDIDL